MQLIISYAPSQNTFTASGRDPFREYFDPFSDVISTWVYCNCQQMFKCYPTVDHIVSHATIRNLTIEFTNKHISGEIDFVEYNTVMVQLLSALGRPKYDISSLYTEIQAFYNGGNIDITYLNAVSTELRNLINNCAEFNTNMMYGYPKTNGIIDQRLDFPLNDVAYIYLPANTLVLDNVKGVAHPIGHQIQVGYLIGNSWRKLDCLLNTPFSTGDLSVVLIAFSAPSNSDPHNKRIFIVSSQCLAIEAEMRLRGKANMVRFNDNVYFAHQMTNGHWLLFDRTDSGMYSIYTALP